MAREHAPDDLVRAVIALSGQLRQAVAEALAPHDITPEQQELLALLASGLRSPGELIQASGRDKTTLSRAVARAASAGLVAHERRPEDRRKQILRLTERGAALAEETARVVKRCAPDLMSVLTPKERRRLAKITRKLHRRLTKASSTKPQAASSPGTPQALATSKRKAS